jgi:SAM-dependent methyltransferase
MPLATTVQYAILKRLPAARSSGGSAYVGRSKVDVLLGPLAGSLTGTIIDFGCGAGAEALELARKGFRVIGLDIRESVLEIARAQAAAAGVSCCFCTATEERADTIVSLDSFEHFADPQPVLSVMHRLLNPGGAVLAAFGPTWYHPLGGHLFSVFPWAHLLFSEEALIRWRSDIRKDGATRFSEVEGGLNQMTIRRFEGLIQDSPFRLDYLECVPIRRLAVLHNHFTREFTTSIVRARLKPR